MVNLPYSLAPRLGPLAEVLLALGFRFDSAYISLDDKLLVAWLAVWIAFLWILPTTQELMRNFNPAFGFRAAPPAAPAGVPALAKVQAALVWRPTLPWAAATALIAAAAFLSLTRVSEFLYFQFYRTGGAGAERRGGQPTRYSLKRNCR